MHQRLAAQRGWSGGAVSMRAGGGAQVHMVECDVESGTEKERSGGAECSGTESGGRSLEQKEVAVVAAAEASNGRQCQGGGG